MSGPYSISDKMIDFTLGDAEYGTVAYLAWLTIGYQRAYPELLKDFTLGDVFRPEYVDDVIEFRDENISLWELNGRLIDKLIANSGAAVPKNMLKDEIVDGILNDPDFAFSQALKDNDTFDWAPNAPTNLYYCEGDDQVTFENAILASQVMNDNGAAAVNALQMDSDVALLDHGGCVAPAATSAIFFFGGFQELLSATEEISFDPDTKLHMSNSILNVYIPLERTGEYNQMSIFNQAGQKVWEQSIDKGKTQYDMSHLSNGMYIITLRDKDQLYKTEKILKF